MERQDKPLSVLEYEADRALWDADPKFAAELGVRGPLRPLMPPNVIIMPGKVRRDWTCHAGTLRDLGYE